MKGWKKKIVALAIILHGLFVIPSTWVFHVLPTDQRSTDVGIWYSTWYAKVPSIPLNWISNFGTNSTNQFLGDVDDDGVEDAVVFYGNNGSWLVALSNKSGFATPNQWCTGAGINSTSQFLIDVNGDGLDDAISVYDVNGSWNVALNNLAGFTSYSSWINNYGVNSTSQVMGDCNGDGMADAIAFYNATGSWHVALSNGTAFVNSTATPWMQGLGVNSTTRLIGDISGDGMADIIAFFNSSGQWHASLSNGSGFETSFLWENGRGSGSYSQMLVDDNSKFQPLGYAYPAWYYQETGVWNKSNSNLYSNFAINSTRQLVGDITGDPNGWKSPVGFYKDNGTWVVHLSHRYSKPNIQNTWEAWNIRYLPLTLGKYETYDSMNETVIDEHLSMISAAGIDFLILDETNNLYVDHGYIFNRAKVLASRVNAWNSNSSNRPLRYAIVTGGIQFPPNNPATLEFEAGEVWEQFVNTVDGGEKNYYHLEGKPLLVNYCSPDVQDAWRAWEGNKSAANQFTLRWADSSRGNVYGWEMRSGSVPGDEVMVVMPGWNNNKGAPTTSRQNGTFYTQRCWDEVFATWNKPEIVIINSFNEYAEETAVCPADTSNVVAPTEKWYNQDGVLDADMYWDMTIENIQRLRNGYQSPRVYLILGHIYITMLLYLAIIPRIMKKKRKED
ncbi:MAG: hypothetical protein ACFFCS_13245 [Candidatus Hodarchaeota archaeon]